MKSQLSNVFSIAHYLHQQRADTERQQVFHHMTSAIISLYFIEESEDQLVFLLKSTGARNNREAIHLWVEREFPQLSYGTEESFQQVLQRFNSALQEIADEQLTLADW